MKIIKYKFLSCEVNHGTEENPDIVQIFLDKSMSWNKSNEAIAKSEAYNGEYTIEDDGQPEIYQPTVQEQLDAQAAAIVELMEVIYNG